MVIDAEHSTSQGKSADATGSRRSDGTPPRIVIDAERTWQFISFAELWRYRELLFILALRDVKVRYRQAAVGAAWAILQPVSTVVVFSVLFGLLGREPVSGETPYPVILLCGLLPWQLFANSVTQANNSLVNSRHVVTKVYFPRMLLPAASILCVLLDFAITFLVLVLTLVWFHVTPSWTVVALPAFVLLTVLAAFGAGLWVSALNALYRDFGYVVPLLIQTGFFVSPVVYETTALIPPQWRLLYGLNPMVVVLEGFRWMLLGTPPPSIQVLLVSSATVALLLLSGMAYFSRVERVIADRI